MKAKEALDLKAPPGTPAWQIAQLPVEQLLQPPRLFQERGIVLRDDQLRVYNLALALKTLLMALDMGLGKTLTTLAVYEFLREQGQVKTALVLMPHSETILRNWEVEVRKWNLPYKTIVLNKLPTEERDLFLLQNRLGAFNLVIISTQAFLNFLKRHQDYFGRQGLINWARRNVQMLICDESHFLCNPTSKIFHAVVKAFVFQNAVPYRFLLSGTPFGDDLKNVWAPYYVLDRGQMFGPDYQEFLQTYWVCYTKPFPRYVFRQEMWSDFQIRLWSRMIRYAKEEVLELPGKHYKTVLADLTPRQQSAYLRELERAAPERHVLRRIASGLFGQFLDPETPKAQDLLTLVREVVSHGGHVIVWHWLEDEGRALSDFLSAQLGQSVGEYRAEIPEAKRRVYLKDWHQGRLKTFVANPASMGQALNLTEARLAVYYSNPDSYRLRKQSEDRIYRPGQSEQVLVVDLASRGTIDQVILEALRQKKSLQEYLFNDHLITQRLREVARAAISNTG